MESHPFRKTDSIQVERQDVENQKCRNERGLKNLHIRSGRGAYGKSRGHYPELADRQDFKEITEAGYQGLAPVWKAPHAT